jgi:hypothetical protein
MANISPRPLIFASCGVAGATRGRSSRFGRRRIIVLVGPRQSDKRSDLQGDWPVILAAAEEHKGICDKQNGLHREFRRMSEPAHGATLLRVIPAAFHLMIPLLFGPVKRRGQLAPLVAKYGGPDVAIDYDERGGQEGMAE